MSNLPDSCGCGGAGGCTCGCCDGIGAVTPLPIYNLPGLSAIRYRAGTQPTFLETMIAGLTLSGDEQLRKLGTRSPDDPAIAFLDGWATLADILTFYQERIANEGYLRTAVERRSVLELGRLIGYRLRPGVSASVYLAYTIDPAFKDEAIIPAGTRSNSVPAPGETQQTFETSDELRARAKWNVLQPRLTRPQTLASIAGNSPSDSRIYFQGSATNLKANDPILIAPEQLFRVNTVTADTVANRTLVGLLDWADPEPASIGTVQKPVSVDQLALNTALFRARSIPPASPTQMSTSLQSVAPESDASFRLFGAFDPETAGRLQQAAANADVTEPSEIQAYAFRVKASLFAANSQGNPTTTISTVAPSVEGSARSGDQIITTEFPNPATFDTTVGFLNPPKNIRTIALDAEYIQIRVGDYIVIDYPIPAPNNASRRKTRVTTVIAVETRTLSFAGTASKVTLVTIPDWTGGAEFRGSNPFLRGTIVYAQSELLPLAEEVIPDPICGGDQEIELDSLYTDLEPGRWLIISGERTDIGGTSGVQSTELLMLSEVRHGVARTGLRSSGSEQPPPLAGDKLHTFIKLATASNYCYARDKVLIYGNVVHATHGETRRESLGNGVATQTFQQATLKNSPLTYTSAATASGVASSLEVIVNEIIWHEQDSFAGAGPNDRIFVTKADDANNTTVIFGDGVHGARTPTGLSNLQAVYRNGIGKPGNVAAQQISQLGDRPLGVSAVINPQESSGGADPETRDEGRRNAPIATIALDRLVSVEDYADFSRTFAGIAKAASAEMPGAGGRVVHVTIAGLDDIPIDEASDLFRNLRTALIRYGDPIQPIQLAVRDRILLILGARIKVKTDYLWDNVEPDVRGALLDTFSFDKRELGQPVFLSEVVATIQAVAGVDYVDVDSFGGIPGLKPDGGRLTPTEISQAIQEIYSAKPANAVAAWPARLFGKGILPAQVAYFAAGQKAAVTLNEVKS